MISKALKIAYTAHQNQVDKGGIPYVQHPIRVALSCMTDDEKIVALLHDVIEDTNVTVEELRQAGFSTTIINAIIALTRIDGEDYMQFIKRLSLNDLATSVKIQDLKDNMDIRRLNGNPHWKMEVYQKALSFLEGVKLASQKMAPTSSQ